MLQLLNRINLKLGRSVGFARCFVNEAPKIDDMDRDKKMKICSLEISVLRQEGRRAPDLENLKPEQWERILELQTKSSRRKLYEFLWRNEVIKENTKEKKEKRKLENEIRLAKEREEKAINPHIVYGLHSNTMFLRIYESTIKKFYNHKLFTAMMFGQKLIIDCSYDEHMNKIEASNTGKQLGIAFAENRLHEDPFDLHFCNFNRNSISAKLLNRTIPTMYNDDFPMNIHPESLTEKFDKKQLVYLTPHCRNDLEEYSHDDIYIIGAMVDKMSQEPLSLAKAKKQGLRMARLPLDRYLSWAGGSGKSLTINQMVKIMLEMKQTGDWEKALKFVPRRKLVDQQNDDEMEAQYQRDPQIFQRSSDNEPNRFNQEARYDSKQNHNERYTDDSRRHSNHGPRLDLKQDRNERFDEDSRRYNNSNQAPRYDSRQNRNERYNDDSRKYNNFNQGSRFDSRQTRNERFDDDSRRNSFDRSRLNREQKHADRYKFDLESWGSKTRNKKD